MLFPDVHIYNRGCPTNYMYLYLIITGGPAHYDPALDLQWRSFHQVAVTYTDLPIAILLWTCCMAIILLLTTPQGYKGLRDVVVFIIITKDL